MSAGFPRGWVSTHVAAVAEVRLGRQRSPAKATGPYQRPYLRAASVTWQGLDLSDMKTMSFSPAEFETYELKPGDILLAEASGSASEVGKPAVWNGEIPGCCFQNTLIRVRSLGPVPRYLSYHFLWDALAGRLGDSAYGVGIHHLGAQRAAQLPLRIAPLAEQSRIVAGIEKQFSRLDAGVAALKRVRAALKRYRAAVLKAACEGKLVPQDPNDEPADRLLARILKDRREMWTSRGKYTEPPVADSTNLPPLPKGWSWATLAALFREPLRNGHSAKAADVVGGLRVFTLTAVTEGDFSERNSKVTAAKPEKVENLWAEPGDIFVERSNTPELVGTARLYNGPRRLAFIPDLFIRVRVQSSVSPCYVEYCLQSQAGRAYFRSQAQGVAGSMPKIDQETVERVPIPLPPMDEQRRIVEEVGRRLSIVDCLEALVQASLKRAARLRQAILKHAFEGKLVPQDPNDEPASALIERIHLESAARRPQARRRAGRSGSGRRGRRGQVSSTVPRQVDRAPK